ncbi:single-stranded DNA-binding protein, mitochondrial-like isoform X2 [Nymphaea colorata]|uniref:single-stranded DNA-binding protein, mitochondrial-like isoform X2 n=1 Tax=Nymphaea colorata TaxID=210225 RepID=UPI00129E1CAF|nr:single-stranded DNA-binding protein, mitochondrial-like isoform X2 [Nymphaea colorata]
MAPPPPALSRLAPSLLRLSELWILPASHSRNLCTGTSSTNEPDDGIFSAETDFDRRETTVDDRCPSSSPTTEGLNRSPFPYRLENGMDVGIYKAILVGQVGQAPVQKKLKSGLTVTLFSIGTGGIHNNLGSFDGRSPIEDPPRCTVQWHRACIYPEPLGKVAMEHVKPGSILYIEGNLETKVFNDKITGVPRQIREIAIRRDGRLVFLENKR